MSEMIKLMLLGAPGAGKGTQAEVISKEKNLPIIGTGNILRGILKEGGEKATLLRSYMDNGKLVPDEIVVELVADRIKAPDCENGFILDGFPRNISQAKAFEDMGGVFTHVVGMDIPEETIVGRLSGRRACTNCGATYHVTLNAPKKEGVCDNCGSELTVRADDTPEAIKVRFKAYRDETQPLEDYYEAAGLLTKVDASGTPEETTRRILCRIETV